MSDFDRGLPVARYRQTALVSSAAAATVRSAQVALVLGSSMVMPLPSLRAICVESSEMRSSCFGAAAGVDQASERGPNDRVT